MNLRRRKLVKFYNSGGVLFLRTIWEYILNNSDLEKKMMKITFLLNKELQELEYQKTRFHALIDYKAQLDRRESVLDRMIGAKRRTNSEYDLLKEQKPKIQSRIEDIKDQLRTT